MVVKGGARAEAIKLAAHLLRVDTNERVLVRELRGVVAGDVTEALREMEAVASGARSRRPFYHASINTAAHELMTDAQKARTVQRLEDELGLTGQPRIVVEHVKAGREHLHVAWLRIDGETMLAIPDSHNFRKHEIVARELELEFGHGRVQGAHHEREGVDRPARCPSHAETRQAERSGTTPAEAKEQLRALWNMADSGQAFMAALNDAGWILAQGDKRGFVALDPAGEVRAVNKDITGLSAAKVRERLGDIDAGQLPTVSQAREQLAARRQQQKTIEACQAADQTKDAPVAAIAEALERAGERGRNGGTDLAATLPPEPQVPSGDQAAPARLSVHPAAQVEEQRPPIDLEVPRQGLLMRVVMAAWSALRSLGERLEKAFSEILGKKPAPAVETAHPLAFPQPEPVGRLNGGLAGDIAAGLAQEKGRAATPRTLSVSQPSPAHPGYTPERKAPAPEAGEIGPQERAGEAARDAAAEAQLERMRRQRAEMIEQLQLKHTKGRGGPSL